MCTAISWSPGSHYFGRNLDLSYSFREEVVITPRQYPFSYRMAGEANRHYALIGMAFVQEDYPLYYDAMNEKGLCMAGLQFSQSAVYPAPLEDGKLNVSPFELIPWLLGQCATVAEAKPLLKNLRLCGINFSEELPLSKLHWILSDEKESLTVEATAEGTLLYENAVGVLTNEPPFPYHQKNLSLYRGLSNRESESSFSPVISFPSFGVGSGTVGLPGNLTSPGRFVRAAFYKENLLPGKNDAENISAFLHLLDSVSYPKGSVRLEEERPHYTIYSSCCSAKSGLYCYKTYENSAVTAVSLFHEDLDGNKLTRYPMKKEPVLLLENSTKTLTK